MGEEETKIVDQQVAAAVLSAGKEADNNEKPIISPPLAEDGVGKTKDKDVGLAQVEIEKKLALIKAWEENEKTKADNKAYKKVCAIDAWENTKRAAVEAELKQIEENFERKKTEYAERMKNKVALLHRAAEEKRAMIEADRGKDFLTVEEASAKFRSTASTPKNSCACFSC